MTATPSRKDLHTIMSRPIVKLALLSACAALLALGSSAFAQSTASQAVTVSVSPINVISVSGGSITVTIGSATAGQNPDQAENTSAALSWTTNQSGKKITVQTTALTYKYLLFVQAGTAAEVPITSAARDVVSSLSLGATSANLTYRATATATAGAGDDVYDVTYTITDVAN